ncbi:hypothetical protein ACFE04_017623 [Oxalis oulophora]
MPNTWCFFVDFDRGSRKMLPLQPFGHVPGSVAIQGAFNCISKLAGAFIFWFSGTCTSHVCHQISADTYGSRSPTCGSPIQFKDIISCRHNLAAFLFGSNKLNGSQHPFNVVFGKIPASIVKHLFKEAERLQPHSVLSLSAAFIPPLNNSSSEALAMPPDGAEVQMHGCMNQRPCSVEQHQRCGGLSFHDLTWKRHAVEPKTGIEFPMMLDYAPDREYNSQFASEVLVGTGSRTMKIIRIKTLKVYAFGFYVHPDSICEKLGPKYAGSPLNEMNGHNDFYQDLLREDIGMSVRLVVNCNGMKINSVRDTFEKSLRARLVKTNPDTDYHCLNTFGSQFKEDIPLPVGTTIDVRRTADGQLITEIGGNLIGAVHSKDLCRAFFDMYIGETPVSEKTKEEIGRNVASLVRRMEDIFRYCEPLPSGLIVEDQCTALSRSTTISKKLSGEGPTTQLAHSPTAQERVDCRFILVAEQRKLTDGALSLIGDCCSLLRLLKFWMFSGLNLSSKLLF